MHKHQDESATVQGLGEGLTILLQQKENIWWVSARISWNTTSSQTARRRVPSACNRIGKKQQILCR